MEATKAKERCCYICYTGFGASVWRYKCTDCSHYFCSAHCKDLWALTDDVDEDEEDPFMFLKHDPPDTSELPFPHGDGASLVSTVAPSTTSASGSKSCTRLLCIECYAPRRMALLRAELYDTQDDLDEISATPEEGNGTWSYMPSLATITPDVVSSGTTAVTSAVGRGVGMGMGLLSGTSSVVMGGGSMVWSAARNVASNAAYVVPSAESVRSAPIKVVATAAAAPAALLSAPSSVLSYFSSSRSPGGVAEESAGSRDELATGNTQPADVREGSDEVGECEATRAVGPHEANNAAEKNAEGRLVERQIDEAKGKQEVGDRLQGTDTQSKKQRQEIVPILSPPQQVEVNAQKQEERQQQQQQRQQHQQQLKVRAGVVGAELAELQQRMASAEALRSKAWLTITMPIENDVWYAGYEGILAWQSQVLRLLALPVQKFKY